MPDFTGFRRGIDEALAVLGVKRRRFVVRCRRFGSTHRSPLQGSSNRLSDPRRFFLDGADGLHRHGNHQPMLRHTLDERTRNSMNT